ncbi:thermonuclease family protein [Nisaea acidiphila]|uniref:Thermonuclease family protein n=1 Tax=Nisaea acidiphila TaxID=1862145 RepID=A0A9J7AXJ5_9PROT|nr:thermonuclease family protein [Nisaea acidiphila]UUX51153.1 thermonuclease family protein [Nisaea acidiphila]
MRPALHILRLTALLVFFSVSGDSIAEIPRLPENAPGAKLKDQAVTEIVDGDTLVLRSGKQVRLVGIQAPKLPLGRVGFEAWPFAEEARAALLRLTEAQTVSLHFGGRHEDRYRRYLAHLTLPNGTWVQGRLLLDGMARVYSFHDNRALIAEMLALERRARSERRGIWKLPHYRIRNPAETWNDIDSFQIVEGRVVDAARIRDTVFLNFGPDWRTDFTFRIGRRALRRYEKLGIDPLTFSGRSVRGRGWVKPQNGPLIELTHPEQLELLPE